MLRYSGDNVEILWGGTLFCEIYDQVQQFQLSKQGKESITRRFAVLDFA